MNDNPAKSGNERKRRVTAEQSLNEALSSLEEILERSHDAHEESSAPAAAQSRREAAATPGGSDDARPGRDSGSGQTAIPLLHDVVMPGDENTVAADTDESPSDDDAQACRQFVERLANEIEVIVHARVEAAVRDAADDIREQVRNHLDIMLPEILDELRQRGRRGS